MREFMTLNIILISICSLFSNCNTMSMNDEGIDSLYMDYDYKKLGYKFFAPDEEFALHYDLEEISGLSYYKPGILAVVQDESGRLFLINTKDGKIIKSYRFDTTGDYEGVEIIGQTAYIAESNGDIFKFKISDKDDLKVKRENTIFTSKNDVEGLGYYEDYLLVACKASGDTKNNNAEGKAIYRLDPKDLEVKKKEWLSFKKKKIEDFIKGRKYFKKIREIDPSGIAVHPITQDIYIISADRIILVFDQNHQIKEVVRLDNSLYRQAEGICFAPDGTLYISNEGEGSRGEILKFSYNK